MNSNLPKKAEFPEKCCFDGTYGAIVMNASLLAEFLRYTSQKIKHFRSRCSPFLSVPLPFWHSRCLWACFE
jgi:hypothetical protein